MRVYKGFNADMTCTMGNGRFQYVLGQKATAKSCKTANTGLHSTEEPFGILNYYGDLDRDVFCICEAAGDINEDELGRISSTELTPLKKLTPIALAAHECEYIVNYPNRKTSNLICRDKGEANKHFVIVRGKDPRGYGEVGTVVFLLQERLGEKEICNAQAFVIDGEENQPGWYSVKGRVQRGKRTTEKIANT